MARGLNKVQIIGNLGADPEMRFTPSGSAVTNFRVAVSRTRRGPDGNNVDETEWFRVVAWDSANYKLAEICDKYLRKGSKVYIEGRLQSRKYTDKEGIERTSVEIVANDMMMLDGRAEVASSAWTTGATAAIASPRVRAARPPAGRRLPRGGTTISAATISTTSHSKVCPASPARS